MCLDKLIKERDELKLKYNRSPKQRHKYAVALEQIERAIENARG